LGLDIRDLRLARHRQRPERLGHWHDLDGVHVHSRCSH
jgi:hypothetical protein